MSRRTLPTLALALAATLGLSACGGNGNGTDTAAGDAANGEVSTEPLTVIADAEPHHTLLQEAESQGLLGDVDIEVTEIAGGVDPNQLVASGDVDVNFFQHTPYLNNWNAEHGSDLLEVASVHIEPLGLYSNDVDSLEALPDGANIAIPADATNLGRALFLLVEADLIEMDVAATDPDIGIAQVTESNITDNPKNLTFTHIDRPQLFATLDDPQIAAAVINGNYALEGGLSPQEDSLVLETAQDNPYVNTLVTTPALAEDPRVTQLADALGSEEIAAFIDETYAGSVLPANE